MKKYVYAEAKNLIQSICDAAAAGEYDSREKFHALLAANPNLAVQGYNAFGKIFFWNQASANLYGHSETAAVNKELFELILPPELRPLARDMIRTARRTGKTPDAAACDLLRYNGEYVTVFSGHVMFQWGNASSPEFYCIDVEIAPQPA
ncbi:MAG: PAS domain-containing protein [Kiritimatiellales bacterium]|nr:PAS domain-containing protein [Kiritimatiellales bacterium]